LLKAISQIVERIGTTFNDCQNLPTRKSDPVPMPVEICVFADTTNDKAANRFTHKFKSSFP
jgi:hypothetical protein